MGARYLLGTVWSSYVHTYKIFLHWHTGVLKSTHQFVVIICLCFSKVLNTTNRVNITGTTTIVIGNLAVDSAVYDYVTSLNIRMTSCRFVPRNRVCLRAGVRIRFNVI